MVLRLALLFAIFSVLTIKPAPVLSAEPVHAFRVVQGLRTDITVPQNTYPQNALVPVTIAVRNVSSRPIRLQKSCDYGYLWVEAINSTRQVVYPPAAPITPPPTCAKAMLATVLRPGGMMQRSLIVLLRRAKLRVAISLTTGKISGAAVTLHFIHGTLPTVTFTSSATGSYSAEVDPSGPVHGPLYYAAVTNCYLGISNVLTVFPSNRTQWRTSSHRTIEITAPPCEDPVYGTTSWHLVAGWLGQTAVVSP